MGTTAASAGTAGPSEGLRAGRSSGRTQAGVHRGEQTTRLRERADDRDAVPDYLLRPTMHGPGGTLLIIAHSFLEHRSPNIGGSPSLFERDSCNVNFLHKCRYFESVIKRRRGSAAYSAITHIPCAVYSCSSAIERNQKGQCRLVGYIFDQIPKRCWNLTVSPDCGPLLRAGPYMDVTTGRRLRLLRRTGSMR